MRYFQLLKKLQTNTITYIGKILIIFIFIIMVGFIYYDGRESRSIGIYSVSSNSMSPYIKKGSIVILGRTEGLSNSDVITFLNPINMTTKITHRISKISTRNGKSIYETKGDLNDSSDPWVVTDDLILGKVNIIVPYVGFLVSVLKSPIGVLLFILLPMGTLLFFEIEDLIKNIRNKIIKRKNKEKFLSMPYGV